MVLTVLVFSIQNVHVLTLKDNETDSPGYINQKVSFSILTGGIFGEVRVNTFRNAIGAHYLAYSSEYVAPPSIDVVRQWFSTIGYGEDVSTKGTLKKSLLPPSKEETKGGSSKVPTSSKTGNSKKRKESSLAMDSNPSQPPVSTLVDPRMHKEDQQATSGPTSLGITSEARANPQLNSGNDASTVSTTEADPGNSAPSIDPHVLADQTKSVSKGFDSPSFKDLDSPADDPVIIIEESDEENDEIHATENVETKDTSVHKSSSPKSSLLKELLVKSLKTELSNILSTNEFRSSLPTELKGIPSKLNELTEEVQGLKNQVHNLEIELPGELKEIPTKLENSTKTITSLLSHVTKALNKFAQVLVSASSKAGDKNVPSAGQADTMPAERKKNTNQATIS
ncbi:hypothetical protein Tco_0984484 [Tanacetum coccineum]